MSSSVARTVYAILEVGFEAEEQRTCEVAFLVENEW